MRPTTPPTPTEADKLNKWYASLSRRMIVSIAMNTPKTSKVTKRGKIIDEPASKFIQAAKQYVDTLSAREILAIEANLPS